MDNDRLHLPQDAHLLLQPPLLQVVLAAVTVAEAWEHVPLDHNHLASTLDALLQVLAPLRAPQAPEDLT